MSSIFYLLGFLVLAFVFFGAIVFLVMKYTGCKRETAVRKVQCFFADKPEDHIYENRDLVNRIYKIICGVIGEARFKERMGLNDLVPIVSFVKDWCPPTIKITMTYKDDDERNLLEALIKREMKVLLKSLELYVEVLTSWEMDEELKMPVLQIRYAVDADQHEAWISLFREDVKKFAAKNRHVLFDSEDDLT